MTPLSSTYQYKNATWLHGYVAAWLHGHRLAKWLLSDVATLLHSYVAKFTLIKK